MTPFPNCDHSDHGTVLSTSSYHQFPFPFPLLLFPLLCLYKIHPPQEPISKVHSQCRLIVHISLQQTHFSRCSVRFVLPVQQSSTSRIRSVSQHDVGCNSEPFHRSEPAAQSQLLWPRPSLVVSVATESAEPWSLTPPGNSRHLPEANSNQFENLNAKSSKPLGSPFHSFGRPRLLSDPTPSVHACVNSPRESSGTTGTFTSTRIGVCCAVVAASASPISASDINTKKGWAHNPVEDGAVDMTVLNEEARVRSHESR